MVDLGVIEADVAARIALALEVAEVHGDPVGTVEQAPNASCSPPAEPPRRDGAALDPVALTWRTVSDAPAGFHSARSAVIGDDVFLLAATDYASGAALLRYDLSADSWATMDAPVSGDLGWYHLVAAGDRLLAYAGTEESGVIGDHVFDPTTATWTPLPPDPLTTAFDRVMVWADPHVYLFDKENVPQPGSEGPSVLRAARLDLAAGTWERLPDSDIIGGGSGWFVDGPRLINPLLGGADGGQVNGWGRVHPNGGILEVATATWTALPDASADATRSARIFNDEGALYLGTGGEVLDATADRWVTMPDLDEGLLLGNAGRAAIALGDDGYSRWEP